MVYSFLYDEISIVFPQGGEALESGEATLIYWDGLRRTFSDDFTIEFSPDNGSSWVFLDNAVNADDYHFEWTPSDTLQTDEALIRVSRLNSGVSGQSVVPFTVLDRPKNLTVDTVCTDFTYLEWDSVPGAVSYEVGIMGEKYIDSLATVSDPFVYVPIDPLGLEFFTVLPVGPNGGKGPRTNTSFRLPGLINCSVDHDVSIR